MMADLIDRQAARHALGNVIAEGATPQELVRNYKDIVLGRIEALPSADVIEVVRCKDCIHSDHWYRDKSRCFLWHESGIDVFDDGYCNYGKRR